MIIIKLREAMEAYRRREGHRITYQQMARATGLSKGTIASIGSRPSYNARLDTISKLCAVLKCDVAELLEYRPSPDALEQSDGTSNRL